MVIPERVDKTVRTMTVKKRHETRRRESGFRRKVLQKFSDTEWIVLVLLDEQFGHAFEEKHELLMILEEGFNYFVIWRV